jgi:hypothetical protein
MSRESKREGRQNTTTTQNLASPATVGYGKKTKVTDLGRVWDGGGGSDGAANSQVGQYYEYARKGGKQTDNAWNDYWRAGSDVYGKRTERLLEQKTAPKGPRRLTLMIDKDQSKEGKADLLSEDRPQLTAEDILKTRLALLKRRGRIAMPSSNAGEGDEPTINISSGGTMGLNFA